MIKRLRLRMSLLVTAVLILVSAGIVLAIYEVNNRNIISQVESALDALAENHGERPALPDIGMMKPEEGTQPPKPESGTDDDDNSPPPKPEDASDDTAAAPPPKPTGGTNAPPGNSQMQEPGARRMNPGRNMSVEEVANLSNYYTMTLDEEGVIRSWESDRSDLYSEEGLQEFADRVMELGKTSGRMDSQFYRLIDQDSGSKLLIVLDARLEMMAGQRVLKVSALVAGLACLILSLGAYFLIRRMVQPVDEAFRKQQQFVWDASHELKTPLAVISANADLLEGEIGENEYLGYIRSEVQRTDSLVRNLLALARMDRGTVSHEMADVDLSEAVLGVLLPFESTVFEAGKTLDIEGVQPQVHVTGNESMLQQLTVILLSNALKYSDPHGTITVRLERKGRGAELRVRNTGDGITPGELERIFDRFYRTDRSRNSETGGEGLGLAIAKSIVEIHRGKIRAESELGEYAEFIVNLP